MWNQSSPIQPSTIGLIGTAAFSGVAGELRYEHSADGFTLVQGDTNGDMVADFEIGLHGQLVSLQPTDFVL